MWHFSTGLELSDTLWSLFPRSNSGDTLIISQYYLLITVSPTHFYVMQQKTNISLFCKKSIHCANFMMSLSLLYSTKKNVSPLRERERELLTRVAIDGMSDSICIISASDLNTHRYIVIYCILNISTYMHYVCFQRILCKIAGNACHFL
jgi:hypothetical protein